MKPYKSLLDLLEEQLNKEGHTSYRTSFEKDRAFFNLPPELRPATKGSQSISSSPVGGNSAEDRQVQPNKDQFKDANKQLSLPGSSTIQQAAYWPTKEYLVVSFKSGHTYSYTSVPVGTVMKWEQASSAGSWFYYNIRKSFPYQKMG